MTLTDSGVFSFFDGTATVRNQNVRQFSLHIYMMLVQPRGDYYRSFVREWNFRCTLYVDYDCPPLVQAPRGKGFPSSKASYSSYRSSCLSPLLQPLIQLTRHEETNSQHLFIYSFIPLIRTQDIKYRTPVFLTRPKPSIHAFIIVPSTLLC